MSAPAGRSYSNAPYNRLAKLPTGITVGASGTTTLNVNVPTVQLSGALTVASQNLSRQTLIVHFETAALRRPKPGNEFDLWVTQNGPRVFGIHEFTGTRMVWLAVEDRVLVADEVWGLMGIGLAPFFDYGGAWYDADGAGYTSEPARLGGAVGLSLRIGPTRAARGDVVEFAVGYRFGEGFAGGPWGIAIRTGIRY